MITELTYAGASYRVLGKTVDEVQQEIDDILALRTSGWLEVVDGHGTRAPYRVLIAAGIPLCLAPLPTDSDPSE